MFLGGESIGSLSQTRECMPVPRLLVGKADF